MLSTVFYFILNMSIGAGVIIIIVLLLRNIKVIKRTTIYMLWAAPFLRLVLPFSFSGKFSLFNYTGGLIKQIVSLGGVPESAGTPIDFTAMNTIGAAESFFPVSYKTEFLHIFFSTISVVWVIGAVAAICVFVALYHMAIGRLKDSVSVKDNIYSSDKLSSPVIVGIIHSKIIVPTAFDLYSKAAQHVLRHEKIHEKRIDNLWRILGITVVCVHWFNPLAWVMLSCFFQDMELSCDELAVKDYSVEERKNYAHTLINFSEQKQSLTAAAFGEANVKHRISNVLNYRKLSVIGMSISLFFFIVLIVIFMKNPSV